MAFQAFLVNKHPSRRCLCTIQHCRDRSRQFCKTLCNVLLTSQLSFKCRILSRQRIHLLLHRSHCIFHWDRVGSHARVESSKSLHNSAVSDRQRRTETVASCLPHVTSRHDHQRVPHSFRDSQLSVAITGGTSKTKDSAMLRYHVCKVRAMCTRCPMRDFDLTSGLWTVHHDDDV